MNKTTKLALAVTIAGAGLMGTSAAFAACSDVSRGVFEWAANVATKETDQFGFGLPMWMTMVDENGTVCHVYSNDSSNENTGDTATNSAWLGSRVISAQKAYGVNAFSIDGLALSSGAVTVATYEGGSLFGLQASNPVDAATAYAGSASAYGTTNDPLVGQRMGGLNLFGGGVALYNANGVKIGAIGASGDTSCRDHTLAYRMRVALGLDNQPNDDGLELIDTTVAPLTALFQQPTCGVNDPTPNVSNTNDGAADDFGIRGPAI